MSPELSGYSVHNIFLMGWRYTTPQAVSSIPYSGTVRSGPGVPPVLSFQGRCFITQNSKPGYLILRI